MIDTLSKPQLSQAAIKTVSVAILMLVLTAAAWAAVRQQETVNIEKQVAGSSIGFAEGLQTQYLSAANSIARMAGRAAETNGMSYEQWVFEGKTLKSDVPALRIFSFVDASYQAQWIAEGQDFVAPRPDASPAQKNVRSQAFLERLVSEGQRVGGFYYASSKAEHIMLIQAPVLKDGRLLGFIGGAIDLSVLVDTFYNQHRRRTEVRFLHDGQLVFESEYSSDETVPSYLASTKVVLGDAEFVLESLATPILLEDVSSNLPTTTLVVGLLFTFVITAAMYQRTVNVQNAVIMQRQAMALGQSKDAMIIHNPKQGILDCSAGAEVLFGYTKSELLTMSVKDLVDPSVDFGGFIKAQRKVITDGEMWSTIVPCLRKDGKRRLISSTDSLFRDSTGKKIGIVSMARDVTEDEQRRIQLANSETRFRRLFESSHDGVVIQPVNKHGSLGEYLANDAYCKMVGYNNEELNVLKLDTFIKDIGTRDRVLAARRQVEERGYSDPTDVTYTRKDGHAVTTSVQTWRIYNDAGEHVETIATIRDISAKKRATALLESSEARFRGLFESSRDGILIRAVTPDGQTEIADVNQAYIGLTGYALKDIKRLPTDKLVTQPEDQIAIIEAKKQLEEQGFSDTFSMHIRHKSGRNVPVMCKVWRTYNEHGEHVQTISAFSDVSESKKAEILFEEAQQIAKVGSWEQDMTTGARSWSKEMYRIFEHDPAQPPLTYEQIAGAVHPDDRESYFAVNQKGNMTASDGLREYRIVMSDGRVKALQSRVREIAVDGKGTNRFVGAVQDITQQRQLEDQLRHTQNLHAVGQMTGGVAHDVNNILGVISSNIQYLEMISEGQSSVADTTKRILSAVEQGSRLTDQMLSFSRKQSLDPQQIESKSFLEEFKETVSRGLGEAVTINLDIDGAIWAVVADKSQLSTALLNLSLNARDAMGGNGQLSIGASNIEADTDNADAFEADLPVGEYVAITVSDTGSGMTEETVAKVFEPFFTTKDVGEGTGLGLSMVYGFAEQSGGAVSIRSVVGEGTALTLYLPAALTSIKEPELNISEKPSLPISIRTILLVEDQEDLRQINEQLLRKLGYRVVAAENGQQALDLAKNSNTHFDVAFLDIILPDGMNGVDLSGLIREERPDIKIVFTTGYASEKIINQLNDIEHDGLFRKPIRIQEVSKRLTEMFGQDPSNSSSASVA